MSFISAENGRGFEAGYFLVNNEDCTRLTKTILADHSQAVTLDNGRKIVPAGAIITGVGLVYEDIDVTNGDAAGSVVTGGVVYKDLLPTAPTGDLGNITFVDTVPTITRPDFGTN